MAAEKKYERRQCSRWAQNIPEIVLDTNEKYESSEEESIVIRILDVGVCSESAK